MTIDISSAVKSPGTVFHAEFKETLKSIRFKDTVYRFCSPVTLKADYVFSGGQVSVEGTFYTSLGVLCSRCGSDMVYPMEIRFDKSYTADTGVEEAYHFEGDTISLDRMVEDNIILALPETFLCKPDCKGLCPVCGADLNMGECGCDRTKQKDNPFSVLDRLFDHDEEV